MFGKIAVAALLVSTLALGACSHTARGMGADAQNNGQAVKKAVQGH